MQQPAENNPQDDWSDRGDYWQEKAVNKPVRRQRFEKAVRQPLILSGYGIRISVDRGTLFILNGFTHYPQKQEEYRFFSGDYRLPSRIIVLDSKGSITFDALSWLSVQNIPLLQINWRGEIQNIGGGGYAADARLVDIQRQLLNTPQGFEFGKWLIGHKIRNSITTLRQIFEPVPFIAVEMLEKRIEDIRELPSGPIRHLLGLEGISAHLYFRSWHSLPVKWKGIKKQPIPEEWLRIGSRFGFYGSNRLAHHPMNAMLNYAYGILENQVRINIIIQGYDPTIGYIHANSPGRLALVFDLMEPLRPFIDAKILGFIRRNVFSPGDFVLDNKGTCRLHPQFARNIVRLVEEIADIRGITVTALSKLVSLGENSNKNGLST